MQYAERWEHLAVSASYAAEEAEEAARAAVANAVARNAAVVRSDPGSIEIRIT